MSGDDGELIKGAVIDPPPSKWKRGDIVTIADDDGVTRCLVTEITITFVNGEPVRSIKIEQLPC